MKDPASRTNLAMFVTQFRKLAMAIPLETPDVPERELMRLLRAKLKQYEEGFRGKPASEYRTIHDLICTAEDWQGILDLRMPPSKPSTFQNKTNRHNGTKTETSNKLSIPAKTALEKQGVDTDTKPKDKDTTKLSAAERTAYMKEGRCFKCKQVGHRASDSTCPLFDKE
jgi:hypothetical protein